MKRDGVGYNLNTPRDQVLSEAKEFLEAYYNTLPEKLVASKVRSSIDKLFGLA